MRLNLYLIVLVSLMFLTHACSKADDKDIYDLVINKRVKPLPPLPLPKMGDLSAEISSVKIDSIDKVELNIAVHPFKIDFVIKKGYESNFYNLKKIDLEYFNSKIRVKEINLYGRESLSFKIVSESLFNSKSIYDKYDGNLQLSTIKYNNDKTEAILIISYSVAKLSSSTLLYFLKKENNNWKIKEVKSLSVS